MWESFPKAYFQQQFEAWEIYFVYECWTVKLLFWLSILLFRVELFSLPFFIVFNSNPSHSTEMGSFSWLKDTVIVGLYQMSFIHIQSFYWGFWMKIWMSVFIFYIIITPKRKLKILEQKAHLNKVIHQIKWCAGAKDIYGLTFIMTLM